jgi:quinol-cytochrome oxidoreductase complex cytochrome b subunit
MDTVVTSALAFIGLGIVLAGTGWLGLTGRLLPHIPTLFARNFAAQLLFGPTLVGRGLILLLDGHHVLVALITVPTVVLFFMGVWAAVVRPPKWLRPRPPERRDETLQGRER